MSNDSENGKHHEGDVAFIRSLAELLNASELSDISVKREYGDHDRLTVKLSKHGRQVTYSGAPATQPATAPAAPAGSAPSAAAQGAAPGPEDPVNLPGIVTSPMVGTAYLSPEPGTPAFVKVGDVVTEGQTLMIVEAMKTMNHIPSPRAGTVRRVLVEDGAPVEYGAPLVIVD